MLGERGLKCPGSVRKRGTHFHKWWGGDTGSQSFADFRKKTLTTVVDREGKSMVIKSAVAAQQRWSSTI